MAKIFKYRATLPNNKIFLREYEVKAEITLYKLHDFLQNDLGFAPDQIVVFEAVDENGVMIHEYGLFDFGDGSMDTVTVDTTRKRGETTLHYVFDINKNRFINLTFLSEEEFNPKESYPRVMIEKGKNPDQFSDKYEDIEELSRSSSSKDYDDEEDLYDEDELPEGEEQS